MSYVLAEGEKARSRLDIQNAMVQDILHDAFGVANSIVNLKGKSLVDFGCGTSSAYEDMRAFIGQSGQYIGVDRSEHQIELNKSRYPHNAYMAGDQESPKVQQILAAADIVFMRYLVMHQKNQVEFTKSIYSILKKGALLVIQEPETDAEYKKVFLEKYPFAEKLYDFKPNLGKKVGLSYNFDRKIVEELKVLRPQKFEYKKSYVKLPVDQAKAYIDLVIREVHEKDQALVSHKELENYMHILSRITGSSSNEMALDLMHTLVIQK